MINVDTSMDENIEISGSKYWSPKVVKNWKEVKLKYKKGGIEEKPITVYIFNRRP